MTTVKLKTWTAEVLEVVDFNAEWDNIYNNQRGSFGTPRTAAFDMDGQELILDADGDTSIHADTPTQIDFRIGGTDRLILTDTTFKFRGSDLITRRQLNQLGVSGLPAQVRNVEHRVLNVEANQVLLNQVFS